MNIIHASVDAKGQMTIHGEVDGFERSAMIDSELGKNLSLSEIVTLGETLIQEAYQRYLDE